MARLRPDLIIVVIGALLIGALGYTSGTVPKQRPSVYSTYDSGPNGYRALYEVLRGAGVPVRRYERVLGVLDPSVRTLIVTGYEEDPSAKPLDEHDAALLKQFVENGGRLVAIDAQFAGPQDIAPGVGTTVAAPLRNDAIVLARDQYTAGVARVHGTIQWVFPFKEPRGIPLLATVHGMSAVLYRVGRGDVIAISAPALLGNAQLRNADNLRFAYNAIAGHGDVAFDEYVHGYDDTLSLWGALPNPVRAAVWVVIAIVLLALIGANVPFAPPYLPTPPDERDSSDYITAIAELMRRSRARPPDAVVVHEAVLTFRARKEHA
jgi:Domain of unknown function (DUF4350)